MNAAAFISHIQELGIRVWADGELLRYSAASGAMTPALRDELSGRKQEILTLLRRANEVATLCVLPPLRPIPRNQDLPLSFAQQRLWFLDQFEPGGSTYNIPFAISLSGNLSIPALERSLQEIVRRHEILRTTFPAIEGKPVQRVSPWESFLLPRIDLQAVDPGSKESEIRQRFKEASERTVDLTRGPLFQAALMRLSESEHLLLVTIHHIIADGWSLGVLVRELASLYGALTSGGSPSLRPLEIQYADFAVWQRGWLEGEVLDHELSYWRTKLAGAPGMLKLPTDRPRPAVQGFRGGTESIRISEEVTAALKRISQDEKSSLFMTLMAAFQILLHRYTGQEDLLVGPPMAGRNRLELEDLVGLFVNTIIVRTDLADNPTFRNLLARVRAASLEAYAHQDLPFERLVEELKPERSLSYTPLFQVMFSLENFPLQALEAAGLKMSPVAIANETSKFDLSLTLAEEAGQLTGSLEYHLDLFDAATIHRMEDHFQTLLEGIARNPDETISSLPLLSQSDKNQLIVEWNGSKSTHLENRCVHQLFEAQVAKTPQAIALICKDQQLSYAELNSRANQIAHCLREMQVGPDVVVGICVERSLDMIAGILGILKAGGAYLPLDPAYPLERMAFMLRDAQVAVLLTQHRLSIKFLDFTGRTVCLDSGRDLTTKYSTENPEVEVRTENLSDVIYTSGSTGVPKGVLITHGSLANHSVAIGKRYELCPQDRVLQFASISFNVAAEELFPSLLCGATVIVRAETELSTMREFDEFSLRHGLTVVNLPAAYWQEWVSELASSGRRLLPTLRLVIAGSESIAPSSFARWKSLATERVRWFNAYGPTEATITSTLWEPAGSDQEAIHTVPIGKPIDNLETYVLDSYSNLVPIGVSGELLLGGEALARGYLNHPDLTAEKFVPNPFSRLPGARVYRTGDVARYLPDGNLEFLGRTDDQVKLRGFRIELGEVESVLNRYPGIREAVVLARDQESGDKRLVAYLALDHRIAFQLSELRTFLRQRLPEYMIPASYVEVAEIARTPAGKIDQRSLIESAAIFHDVAATHVAPRDSVEELISSIWSTLLGRGQIGVHDNFFDLGGHSLLATQVISRLREAFGVELSIRQLFEDPTVGGLAAGVEAARQTKDRLTDWPIVRVSRGQVLPLSFAQERLWFFDQMEPGSPVYIIPTVLRLRGPLKLQALTDSFCEVIRRHDVLRTTFPIVEGRAVQRVVPFHSFELPITQLQEVPEGDREARALELATAEARRPFDLTAGPLWRAGLLKLGESEHLLLLMMHHIISDEWSIRVLVRELRSLSEAFLAREPTPPAELPVQYAEFAFWQRQALQGEALARQLSYWKEQLRGAPTALEMRKDHPRPLVQTFRGASARFMVSGETTSLLRELARQENATLFMVLLAAFQTWLHRYTDQLDIVVGSPIAGRTRRETEGLIGFFVNTLVLRVNFQSNPTFREVIRRVRKMALGAYAHQDLPFEKLVEMLQPDRQLSHSPLFQVMFLLQNDLLEDGKLGQTVLTAVEIPNEVAKFDLTLAMEETGEGLAGWLNYNTDLFEMATAERMVGHFQTLLARLAAKPLLQVSDCSLLTPAEEEQLLLKWNQTVRKFPEDLCLHEQIQRQVQEHPDATAITFQGQRLSYGELNDRANQVAHRLRQLGVGPEILVAICMERSCNMVVGLLAILKAGGAYVPLDPAYPPARLALILEEAAIPVLLTQEKFLSQLPPHASTVLSLDGPDSPLVIDHGQTGLDPLSPVTADNLAYVIYTSGSTGKPKGVMILHRGLTNYLAWCTEAYRVADGQGAPVHSSISFDLTVTAIFSPLLAGREIHLLPEEAGVEGLSADLLTQKNYSLVKITPAHLDLLSRFIPKQEAAGRTRALIIGGENLAADSIAFWQRAAPETVLVNEYGPTETVVGCCVYQVAQGRHHTGSIPIGRPIANTQLYILDRRQQPAPVGVPGELHIGGAGLARGYLNSPELTAEKFIPNPFCKRPGGRLYRTGDLCVYLPDGNIEYLGRVDHQVKIRGFRIELGEIEGVLAQHPAVRECVVLSRQDLPGEARLAAYLVPQNSALTPGEVRDYLKGKLPGYMIPSAFLMLESLPVTANGKVDRKALPAPAEFQNQVNESFQAPSTLMEKELAPIWCDVLNHKQSGVHDNFFDSGGHSLLAIQLLFRIKDAFQVSLPVRALFEAPTISQMAERITEESQAANRHSQRGATPWAFLTPIQPAGLKRPLYLVPGGIGGEVEFLVYARLARHLGLNQPLYGLKARGSDGKQKPHTQVSQMAADYIREIRAFQPESPYMLAGECIGGIVAFEVARQLRAQGQEVSLLALLDTACPRRTDYLKYCFEKFMIRWRKSILVRTFHHLTQLRRVPSRERLNYLRENYRKAKARFGSSHHPNATPHAVKGEGLAALRPSSLLDHYFKTLIRHKPKVYPGRITLLVSEESYRNDPSMGWSRFAKDGLDIHPLPGDHQTYIREYLQAAATCLKKCLEKL